MHHNVQSAEYPNPLSMGLSGDSRLLAEAYKIYKKELTGKELSKDPYRFLVNIKSPKEILKQNEQVYQKDWISICLLTAKTSLLRNWIATKPRQ